MYYCIGDGVYRFGVILSDRKVNFVRHLEDLNHDHQDSLIFLCKTTGTRMLVTMAALLKVQVAILETPIVLLI